MVLFFWFSSPFSPLLRDLSSVVSLPTDARPNLRSHVLEDNTRFDASQYDFFGRDAVEEVELGGLEGDGDEDAGFLRTYRDEVIFSVLSQASFLSSQVKYTHAHQLIFHLMLVHLFFLLLFFSDHAASFSELCSLFFL